MSEEQTAGKSRKKIISVLLLLLVIAGIGIWSVSYTHLDVYKRQTLYVVKAETGETQVSSMARASAEIGTVRQTGTMEITNTTDVKEADRGDISYTKITYPVIGKTITAELKNANNVQGTWKWYKSKTTCGDDGKTPVPATDSDAWEQLASGYSPTINKKHSTLTISEDLWKHYIKAEFVPNNELGYGGDSIKQVNTNYVRKIYNEQITIESSTKDGNGNQTVYTGTKVTALVENWTGKDLKGRFKLFINEDSPKEHTNSTYTENEMNIISSSRPCAGWCAGGPGADARRSVTNFCYLCGCIACASYV